LSEFNLATLTDQLSQNPKPETDFKKVKKTASTSVLFLIFTIFFNGETVTQKT